MQRATRMDYSHAACCAPREKGEKKRLASAADHTKKRPPAPPEESYSYPPAPPSSLLRGTS